MYLKLTTAASVTGDVVNLPNKSPDSIIAQLNPRIFLSTLTILGFVVLLDFYQYQACNTDIQCANMQQTSQE